MTDPPYKKLLSFHTAYDKASQCDRFECLFIHEFINKVYTFLK